MSLRRYYGPKGPYLKEHKEYFTPEQLQKDVNFLIKALRLKKKDKILDIACGNGRHTIELKKRGYNIDGLDFSGYLIRIARKRAKQENLEINFYTQDMHKINLKKKYDKIFLFFSDFRTLDADEVLKNVTKIMEKKGMFLLDCDNVFRVIAYLKENSKAPYKFDFIKMELLTDRDCGNKGVRYYTFPEFKRMFDNNNLFILSIYGNYDMEKLDINSQRIIIIGNKK
jgi:ubiquinone/menaquinone biosynthesis C-methylase UbiE